MNFEKELKKRKTNIRACSYFTVAKLARFLGYRPDEIVYEKEDFQTFRNNLHHRIKSNELECILEIIESDDVSTYMRHEDYQALCQRIQKNAWKSTGRDYHRRRPTKNCIMGFRIKKHRSSSANYLQKASKS